MTALLEWMKPSFLSSSDPIIFPAAVQASTST
eukprot:CAMPEP_0167774868 /NCGR_PEP_ID=MMETSP0111_2-20121227/2235_1 /TAXON_ID=91324 /ORGANISM="Lotharella globosa, Strain CCCM811" /LENGTH=31 /DNA_ID= /DNA_START= /DNA_END= /DNA_ORIENTATION=